MTGSIEKLVPQFVEFIPKVLEPGVLYISVEYTTTAHRCACGCGEKVVLPLHPTDWRLTFDGKSITMRPSVGNWGFPCRSHYLITCNRIEWAENWSDEQISAGRIRDAKRRSSWHGTQAANTHKPVETPAPNLKSHGLAGFIRRMKEFVTQFRR
ncbi:DUF6527 family protein [Roseibium sediminicola]|uniref:DUF6527 family protein n=1 Tax=Roseibium sediminicola TaxID=2933272 RepID=A0ABT0GZZ6_9HYPH|nr:DUF6527 family protein [Roseibium sp. CAU 1639]MCK7615008.1 DUF6527 family protein [Roseibium sp. CAU 1639]